MPMDALAAPAPATHAAKPAGPCAMVIFGAGGDLTKRLVIPALYNLTTSKLLPDDFALIGVDIASIVDRSMAPTAHRYDAELAAGGGEFQTDSINMDVWKSLLVAHRPICRAISATMRRSRGSAICCGRRGATAITPPEMCCSTSPSPDRFFGPVAEEIAAAGLADQQNGKRWRRVIVEKPFGHDLSSAKALNARLLNVLDRGSDLSDRSFSRQGNGAKHHGGPVCQRLVRADLEPRPHRSRADHRRRNRRCRAPRPLL